MTPATEKARLDALDDLAVLDTPREDRFDRVVRLAQRLFDVPMVAISLLDGQRQWHKANVGLDFREGPRTDAFCNRTIEQAGPFVVPDASSNDEFKANPMVTLDPGIRFYAGQPLAAPGGQRVGSLCILDKKPRQMSPLELGLLRDLADWVEKELATDQELVEAGAMQRRLLPTSQPQVPGYDIAGRCLPSRAAGGDFFDWYPVGEQFQVVVADVMGKGVAAAIIAASLRALVRGASRHNDVAEAINRTAFTLEHDLSETSSFATLFCGRLDPDSGRLTYVDAGHGLTGVIRASGRVRLLLSDGLPLGIGFGDELRAHSAYLAPGDTLVSVSDGFLDYFDDTRAALTAALTINGSRPTAQEMVDQMCRLGGDAPRSDDLTVVVVRRTGQP